MGNLSGKSTTFEVYVFALGVLVGTVYFGNVGSVGLEGEIIACEVSVEVEEARLVFLHEELGVGLVDLAVVDCEGEDKQS
jgi:hypothetical protein